MGRLPFQCRCSLGPEHPCSCLPALWPLLLHSTHTPAHIQELVPALRLFPGPLAPSSSLHPLPLVPEQLPTAKQAGGRCAPPWPSTYTLHCPGWQVFPLEGMLH